MSQLESTSLNLSGIGSSIVKSDESKIKSDLKTRNKGEYNVPEEKMKDSDKVEIRKIVEEMNIRSRNSIIKVSFVIDDRADIPVILLKDRNGQVIKQIPSEDVLMMKEKLDKYSGLIFSSRA